MAPQPKPASVPADTEKSKKILASRIRPSDTQIVESLEPRIVFSVNIGPGSASSTSLTNAQVNEIIHGLEDIGQLWNALEQEGALDQNIGALGTTFADLFNFGSANGQDGFFGDAFRDQLDDLLHQAPVSPATGPTVSQINTWLNTSPLAGTTGAYTGVTWSLNQGGEYSGANQFEWEVTIGGSTTSDLNFVAGSTFASEDIAVSGAKVSTTASTSFKFSFGLTDSGNFFATFGDLSFGIDGVQPSGGVGGTATYTKGSNTYPFTIGTGSTVTAGVDYTGVKVVGSEAADGKFTRLELATLKLTPSASDYTITSTTDSGLQGTFRLTTAGGVPVQLLFNDSAILTNNNPTIAHDVALIDYVAGGNVTGIFQKIQDIGALLDNNPLRNINLPGIGTALDTIEGLPAFGDLLSLRNTVNSYMTTVAAPTFNGLTSQVQTALTSALASAGITLNTFTVTSEFDPATSAMILTVNVDTGNLTKTFDFDRFGSAASQAGISFNRDETLSISGTVRAQAEFGFGLNLVQPASNQNSVFFETGGIDASIKFDATGIDLSAILGPVAADIVDGEVHGTGKLALSMNNAATGRVGFGALNVPEGSLGFVPFNLTATGSFDATLPLDIKIAGASFTNPFFKFVSPNLFTKLPTLDTSTPDFDKLFNIGKIGPEAILDLIIAVGDWAANFRGADIFDFNIPFLNADLGSAFDFGLLFTKNLRDHLQDDKSYVALNGDFASFTLAAKAPLLIGNGEFSQRIELPAGTYATKAGFITALNTALGTGSKFEAQDHGASGVRIAAKDANEIPSFSVLGSKLQLKTIGFVDSSAVVTSAVTLPLPAVETGKLTADAQFTLSIDGATPVTITVSKTSTDNNDTVDNDNATTAKPTVIENLADDIDAALTSYGIDATVVGGKIKLTKTDGKSFMITGVSGTTFQQLGLENASAAGLADVGSVLESGLTYETLTDMVPFLLDELGIIENDGDPSNDPIRASYDIATQTFYLHFEHTFIAPTVTLPVGFNFELEGFANIKTVDSSGNPANATLSFIPTIGGSFDFGISIANDSSFEELSITAPTGFAPKGYGTKADGSPDPNKALAWDGKLNGDASFKVSFEDGVEHTLTILKSSTDANTSMADLLADVKAAIQAAGLNAKLDARVIAKDGGTSDRIEFFTKEQSSSSFQTRNLRIQPTGADKMGFVPDQLELSNAPILAVANNAQGNLDFSPAGDVVFSIGLEGGAPVKVTVTEANMADNTKMPDLLADINAAIAATSLAGKVKAIRYGLGSQFQLVTADGTRQITFSADSVDAQTTLNFGTEKITARSRGGTFFVKDAKLEASGTITLQDLNLETQLGFIGITTNGLEGSVTLDAEVLLKDSSNNNTRFEIGELFSRVTNGSIGDIVQVDFDGTATAKMTGLQVNAGILDVGLDAEIELTGTNLFAEDGPSFAVTYNGIDPGKLSNLLDFSKASWQDIYEGIKLGVQVLGQTEQFSFLGDTKIPLINLSIAEIFTYTDKLVEAIDQLEQDPAGALEEAETRIEELLGIPAESFDLTLDENSVLRIHLGISTTFSASYGLDFNLAEIAKYTNATIPADLLTLGGFLDASAEGSLQFGAYAGMSLDLGLDFSNGATSPSLIVYSTSGVDLGLRLSGQNLNISASLGPVGFKITDGSVMFDGDGEFDVKNNKTGAAGADGLQDNDFATLHFGPLDDITDLQGTIDDIASGTSLTTIFGPTFTGAIKATLPGSITSDIGDLDLPGPIVLDVPQVSKLFSSDAAVRKTAATLTLPDMTELLPEIPGLIQLLRNPAIVLDGVDSALGAIQRLLSGKSATKLPLLGDQLRKGAGFIDEFRAGFLADLTDKLRGAGDSLLASIQLGMFDLFGPASDDPEDPNGAKGAALGLLQDYNGDGSVTKDDVVLTFRKVDGSIWVEGDDTPQSQDAIQFNLHLGQSITFGTDLEIDWGLPGLDLDINGSPSITAGWDLYLGFGVSVTDFFYLDSAPPVEFIVDTDGAITAGETAEHALALGFEAVLTSDETKPFKATGRLFFLQLDAADQKVDDEYSHVSGAIFVDLTDPGVNNNLDERITIRELFSRGSVSPISAGLEAEAIVNLGLTASVGGNTAIPRILADFNLEWNFELGQPVQTPDVSFSNVQLDLGSFISDFLKPIVNKVDEIIKPFDPVLDALQTRIPVLSDIMGRNYTVLDLAVQFGKVDRRFVDAVLQIRELVADIADLPDNERILIPIGDLADLGGAFSTKTGAKNVNTAAAGGNQVAMPANANQQYRNTFTKATSVTGGGFGFPIFQPANAFKLLLGQDATLITYDIPRLTASMSMSRTFPIWGPLVGKFNGSITAYADFAVGFDTKGFNTFKTSGDVVDILDGFYVSDRANADGTGEDVYEAGFMGRIGIGGAINAAIIEAGIEGFFELRADLDLKDPNDDGKIRGSEIIALLTHPNGYGPLNLGSIRLRGDVGARAYVDFWAPFDWYNAWEWEFARLTLFDKTFTAPDVTPVLAETTTSGSTKSLDLNAGPTATKRDFISTSDVGEEFLVTGSGKNITVTFTNTGHTQTFSDIDELVFNGGKGNDRLIIDASVTTKIIFNGGEGDDEFTGGAGDDVVIGGLGNDIINGGGGNNTLDGGAGADEITGGSGNDTIIGGLGDDIINGKGGDDTYQFADDWGSDLFDGDQTGTGTFDFSPVTKDLTLNISATGAQGISGKNFISFDSASPYITLLKGGSGNDTATVSATALDANVTIDGGFGSDQYIVSFNALRSVLTIDDTGSGQLDSDLVKVQPVTKGYAITVNDDSVTGTSSFASFTGAQTVQFGHTSIENLTVDSKTSTGSSISIGESITFDGQVRLLAPAATINHSIDAGNVYVQSTGGINIAANVNAHANGDVSILVSSGNITISEDVMSTAGTGFVGDGAGLIHLFTSGGAILSGQTNGQPGRVLAEEGSLLLRGTNGSIGTINTPIYSTVAKIAASTTGSGLINVHESDGVTVDVLGPVSGINTTGGILNLFNDAGEVFVNAPITLSGGDGTITTDRLQINADITSPDANLFIRPEGELTTMAIGDNVTGVFDVDQSEINHIINGFASLQIGLPLGRNLINLGDSTFQDVTLIQNPILGGHINQTGLVTVTDGASFTILGSGHTIELDNQIAAGNIDIIDSAVVRQGETVTLQSGGAININFDVDGTAGGADETLILNATNDVTIKGAIGSAAQLGTLNITGGTNVHFEGSVNVKHLVLSAGTTFTVDGTLNAEDITIAGIENVTFHSGITLSTAFTSNGTDLVSIVFEGQVVAPSVTVTAKQLVDFYQLVDVTTALNVKTTLGTGDIVFRQQVNAHLGDIAVEALDDITFIGPVAGDQLNVTKVDALAFQANVELLGALVQTTGTGVTTFEQLTAASANLTSAGVILGGITTFTGAAGLVVNTGSGIFSAVNSVSAPNGPLNITSRSITFQSTVAAEAATLNAGETISVVNAANFTLDAGLIANTTNPSIGEIKFSGPVDIGTTATLNTPRGVTFQSTLEVDGALTVANSSSATFGDAVVAASATVTAVNTINVAVGGFSSTVGGISLTTSAAGPGNAINALGILDAATALNVTTPRGATLNLVDAGAFTVNAASIALNAAVTTAGQTSLTATTGGNITAASTISAGGDLVVTKAKALTFGNLVTADNVLIGQGGTDSIETVSIGVGGMTAANDLRIRTHIPGAGNGIVSQGALTSGTTSVLALQSARGVDISGSINAGDLTVIGTAITLRSSVNAVDEVSLNSGGDISVSANLTAGGAVAVTQATALTFGAQLQGGSLSIANTGSASFIGKATLTGAANIALTGDMTTNAQFTAGAALNVSSVRDLSFGGFVNAASVNIGSNTARTVTIGTSGLSASGNITIDTDVIAVGSGIITNGPVSAGASNALTLTSVRGIETNSTLSASDITINGSSVILRSTATAGDDVTLTSTGDISVNANLAAIGDISVTQAAALTFGAQVDGGSLTIANTASAVFTGKTTITGAINIAVTGDMTTNAQFTAGGALNVSSVRDLTFGGFVNAASVNIGSTTARTVSVGTSGLTSAGNITIATNVIAVGSGIITNGPVTTGASNALTLTSVRGIETNNTISASDIIINGSSITLRSTANASDDVTLTSTGDISVNANLTAIGDIAVTQAAALTFGAQVDGGSLSIANTASAVFAGKTTIGGPVNIAVTGDMTTNAQFTATGALNVTSVRDLTFGGFVSAASVNIGSTTAWTVSVGTSGLTSSGNITIATNVAAVGSGIITNGPVSAGASNALTLTSVRGIETNNTLSASDIIINGSSITLRSTATAGDDVTLTSTGDISVNANLAAIGDIAVTQAAALTFGAQVDGGSLSIANTASAVFTGKTTIGGPVNIAVTGDMTTSAQFTAAGALNVTSVRDLTFGGFVSAATVNIGSTTARTVTAGAAGITATGDILIATNVAGVGTGIVTNGPVTAGAVNAITLNSVRGVEVNNTLSASDVNIIGAPIIVRSTINAGDDLTLSSTGSISIQSDITVGDDVIVNQATALSFGAKVTAADLLVTNTGSASFAGEVLLSNTASLTLTGDLTTNASFSATNSISVPSARDITFGGAVASATVSVGSTTARTVTVGAAGVTTSGALTLRSTDPTGGINLNGPLTTTSGAVTLAATAAITSTASITGDTIAATSPAISLGGALTADGAGTTGTIALNSTAAGTGTINIGGAVTSTGSLSAGTIASPLSAAFTAALSIGQDFTVAATEGISTGAQVNVTRDTSFATTSSANGEVRVNGLLSTGRDLLLSTPRNATFIAPVTAGRDATITNAAQLQFDGALTVTGNLTQVDGTVSSRFASISAASIGINSPTITVTNAVTATTGNATFTAGLAGKVTVGGNTTVAGALSVPRADEVILTGNVTAASINVGATSVRTMTFGTNLVATTGNVTLTGTNGAITVAGSLNAAGSLAIPSGTVITLNGAVTAANATIAGGTLVTGNDVTTTSGGLAITSTGDVTVAGKTTVAQTLSIIGSDDVNLAGAISARDFTLNATSFLAGSTFTTTLGDANFTTSGNIRVVGLTTVAEDLTITTAKDTTFQGQVSVTESLTQIDGIGNTRFESSTNAADIAVRTNQLIFAGSTLRSNTGDMRLESNEIDFFGGTNAVQGSTNLVLRPYSFGASIDIGSPTPTGLLDLSDVDLNAIQAGFDQIIIGRSEDGTGSMLIGSSIFKNDVAFHAGSITVENNSLVGQVLLSQESIEMTARTGSILTNDDIFATDIIMTARDNITINQGVNVADFVTLTAGTDGSGTITHNGTVTLSSPTGNLQVTAGAASGDILITGSFTTFESVFTAVNGIIKQTSGLTTSSDILALARDGITLLTSADHISARVTSTGDLNITDTNSDPLHFLDLGSKTDLNGGLFTADGDITVIADQNANAFRLVANGGITIEVGGEVYLDKVSGAPVSVTGTILIDEDRTTNGEEIRFDGNIRLLRDITLTSNGGDITITGRVNGTAGQHYSLTFNAGGGDVTIGNGIGNVTPLEFLQVNDAGTFTLGNASRVEHDIEINADAVVINAPTGTILTTMGGELRLLPNDTAASIDIGGPAGANAAFSFNDSELAALGNGFSRIQVGQSGGNHAIKIESAIFRDDLEINGDSVNILTSSVAQAVNGLSAVNGHDDNDIIINAKTSYTQGSHAALTAGRNGNIAITADNITLDGKSRGLIRGFGELLLQPFTASQPIVLGGTGAGFELSATEFGAIGDTFSQLIIGRADGSHAINIQTSLNFRDNTLLRAPVGNGSVTIGSGLAPITIQTLGRGDNLTIEAGGNITVDGTIKTVGRGNLEILADFDENGAGDLLIGQNLGKPNKTLTIGSELGAISLQGENITIGIDVPTDKKAGIVAIKSLSGSINTSTNLDGDTDGSLTFRHAKSTISTGGSAKLESANHGGTADLGAGLISALRGLDISGFESVVTNATKLKSNSAINIEAVRATIKAKSAFSTLASLQIIGNQSTGVVALEAKASISASKSILLDAADVQRDAAAIIKTKSLVIDEI